MPDTDSLKDCEGLLAQVQSVMAIGRAGLAELNAGLEVAIRSAGMARALLQSADVQDLLRLSEHAEKNEQQIMALVDEATRDVDTLADRTRSVEVVEQEAWRQVLDELASVRGTAAGEPADRDGVLAEVKLHRQLTPVRRCWEQAKERVDVARGQLEHLSKLAATIRNEAGRAREIRDRTERSVGEIADSIGTLETVRAADEAADRLAKLTRELGIGANRIESAFRRIEGSDCVAGHPGIAGAMREAEGLVARCRETMGRAWRAVAESYEACGCVGCDVDAHAAFVARREEVRGRLLAIAASKGGVSNVRRVANEEAGGTIRWNAATQRWDTLRVLP